MTARRIAPLLAALALLAGCDEPPPPRAHGYVEAETVRLAAPAGGWIRELAVRRGDTVAAGEPLFRLDDDHERAAVAEARARLSQAESQLADLLATGKRPEEIAVIEAQRREAEARLRFAESDRARLSELVKTDSAARRRLDEAESTRDQSRARVAEAAAQIHAARLPARADAVSAADAAVEAARAALAQAEWRLSERRVAAPVAARVEDTPRLAGEYAPAGAVVVTLLPPEGVKVRFYVPEPWRARFEVGQRVHVACDGCAPGLTARVSFIAAEAEFTPPVIYSNESRARLVFRIEARPEGAAARLAPGQPVEVEPPP